jgi:hypothetical protein
MVNDDANGMEPVLVRRAAYDSGLRLRDECGGDRMAAMDRAQEKVRECKAADDEAGVAFWNSAWSYLMDAECATAGAETIILEEGETYDYDEGEVIRPRAHQPRNDTGFR